MKKITLQKIVLQFLVVCCMASAYAQTYLVSTDVNYAPFSFHDGKDFMGIDIDLINLIAEDQGFEIEFTSDPFSRLFELLEKSERDIIIGGMSITSDRVERFHAMDGYAQLRDAVLIDNQANYDIASVADIANYAHLKIGVSDSTSYEDALRGINFPNIVIYDSSFLAIKGFIQGEVDAVLDGYTIFKDVLKRYPTVKYDMILIGAEDQFVTFYLNKKDDELLQKLNAGLATVREDGRLKEILDKYIK